MQILIAMDCDFFWFYFSEEYIQFKKKNKKHLSSKIFGSSHTSNQIYFLQICFLKYLYLKDI